MLIIKAQMRIASKDKASFLDAVQPFVNHSRSETGCLDFGCYEDTSAEGSFVVFEQWADQRAFEAHESSAHLAQFKASISAMIVSREATRVYRVSEISGLPTQDSTQG